MSRLFQKIRNGEVYIIAEMSANHGGNLENALRIVREAAAAGADCLKIQTYTADSLTIDCDKPCFRIEGTLWDGYKLYDLYQDAGTPYEWHAAIKKECEDCGIDFLSTPFDNAAVDFLEELGSDQYKIASFELVDIPLIEYAASKGKPMIISCGMGSAEEIGEAVEACKRVGNDRIVLLKCCSEYPANWPDMHLSNIPDMAKRFQVPVGLSDHSEGYLAAVVGVSMGACVVEKHVKLNGVNSADSAFSMPMEAFAEMVKAVRDAKTIAGNVKYGPTEGEKALVKFRRSLFAVDAIKKGESFTGKNVRSIRPSNGLKPVHMRELLGKNAVEDISFGTPICKKMFEKTVLQDGDLTLREIQNEDAELIVKWRSNPDVYKYFCNPKEITLKEHLSWFQERYLSDPDRLDFIAYKDCVPAGLFHIQKDSECEECAEVSYLLDPAFYGKGIAKKAVDLLMEYCKTAWECKTVSAVIHEGNNASLKFIKKLGFTEKAREGSFLRFEREI